MFQKIFLLKYNHLKKYIQIYGNRELFFQLEYWNLKYSFKKDNFNNLNHLLKRITFYECLKNVIDLEVIFKYVKF